MALTSKEKVLIQKVPEQWRDLLSPLLIYRSVKHEHLMSVLAMQCRRRSTPTAASWDMLLTAMSRHMPVVAEDGSLCFQRVLWCFPESFVHGFLNLLLRFHDTMSLDSLDRFLCACVPVPDTCEHVVSPLLLQLSASLDKYSGARPDDQTPDGNGERTCMLRRCAKKRNGEICRGRMATKQKEILGDNATEIGACVCNPYTVRNSSRVLYTPTSKIDAGKLSSDFSHSSVRDQDLCSSEKLAPSLPTLSGKTSPSHDSAVKNSCQLEDDQNKPMEKRLQANTVSADSKDIVIVLDSSDEEENGAENMNVKSAVGQREVKEVEHLREGVEESRLGKSVLQVKVASPQGTVDSGGKECRDLDRFCAVEMDHGQTAVSSQRPPSDGGQVIRMLESNQLAASEGNADLEDQGTMTHMQRLREVLMSRERDTAASGFDFLLSMSSSQVGSSFASVEWASVEEEAVCALLRGLLGVSHRLSHAVGAALVSSILTPVYECSEGTPSRHLLLCLSDVAATFPQLVASTLCDCLHQAPCNAAQSELVTSVCKNWDNDMLLFFLRSLCKSSIQLDDNLLSVAQCVLGRQPDLSSDLLESVLHLLETGAASLARNAKYGRLVLSFVKNYKNQLNSSHMPTLQSVVSVHSSVIRKSLQSAVNTLPT